MHTSTNGGAHLVTPDQLDVSGRLAFTTCISTPIDGSNLSINNRQYPQEWGCCSTPQITDDCRNITFIDVNGANLTQFPAISGALRWSPDKEYLFITTTNTAVASGRLAVVKLDGSGLRQVTNDASSPTWSPDGSRLAFVSHNADYTQSAINIMSADGSGQGISVQNGANPSWSPDGQTLAFDDQTPSIFVINADGSNRTQIVENGSDAVWSPDGMRIAFFTYHSGNRQGIAIADADGTNVTHVADDLDDRSPMIWSPDGVHLMYIANRSGRESIAIINIDTTQRTYITDGHARNPTWSPDGKRIAFLHQPWSIRRNVLGEGAPGTGIFVVTVENQKQVRLTSRSVEVMDGPVWSPNGMFLAFTATEGESAERSVRQPVPAGVFVVAADGSAMAKFSDDGTLPTWEPIK